jgi:excisionase family DNA binding protein
MSDQRCSCPNVGPAHTIYRFVGSGELSGFQLGKSWRFQRSDIYDWIVRQANKAGRKS